jgi:hypothetical protein
MPVSSRVLVVMSYDTLIVILRTLYQWFVPTADIIAFFGTRSWRLQDVWGTNSSVIRDPGLAGLPMILSDVRNSPHLSDPCNVCGLRCLLSMVKIRFVLRRS